MPGSVAHASPSVSVRFPRIVRRGNKAAQQVPAAGGRIVVGAASPMMGASQCAAQQSGDHPEFYALILPERLLQVLLALGAAFLAPLPARFRAPASRTSPPRTRAASTRTGRAAPPSLRCGGRMSPCPIRARTAVRALLLHSVLPDPGKSAARRPPMALRIPRRRGAPAVAVRHLAPLGGR